MAERAYLAIDMGASSGRHVVGLFDGQKLRLKEVYRFENGPVEVAGNLYWDLLGLWSHVRQGLRAASAEVGGEVLGAGPAHLCPARYHHTIHRQPGLIPPPYSASHPSR